MNTRAPILSVHTSPLDLADAAAEQFARALLERRAAHPARTVAFPGGRIYAHFFPLLRQQAEKHPGLLDSLDFFWSDERCAPPESDDSNYRLARETLLEPLRVPQGRIHRIRGELPPRQAAQGAEVELRRFAGADVEMPALDFVFLGMGEDGHVASLFPGEEPRHISGNAVYRSVVGPKPPPNRITLGYAPLWAAAELWILISGGEKSGALKQSLTPGAATPLGRVLAKARMARLFTDFEVETR
jgi:6-phosphogluconolactonase